MYTFSCTTCNVTVTGDMGAIREHNAGHRAAAPQAPARRPGPVIISQAAARAVAVELKLEFRPGSTKYTQTQRRAGDYGRHT